MVPVCCALTCISCDLPATRKLCGFVSFSASQGCTKCQKHFPFMQFGEKLDYTGYDREEWIPRIKATHMMHVSEIQSPKTASRKHELEFFLWSTIF